MPAGAKRVAAPPPREELGGGPMLFSEAPAWRSVGAGWRPLFGSFTEMGFSFEWHEFVSGKELDWAASFHPGSVELCLNLEGIGRIEAGLDGIELQGRALAFYFQGLPGLKARRRAGESHRFITVEFSVDFLREHFGGQTENLHPLVRAAMGAQPSVSQVSEAQSIGMELLPLVESLRHCPVFKPAQEVWFRCKALELASQLFFRPAGGELFCTRTQRVARERVERARAILRETMHQPPSLEELGRMVGCSPFHLSRQFSQATGFTIQQYLQSVRMGRAAELLRTGKCNVTEAALEVGYNSISHFSTVFRETFGCCPGLYPLKTPAQRGGNGASDRQASGQSTAKK